MKSTLDNADPKKDLYDMEFKRIICIDFDGVIHWYREGWSEGVIYDKPTPGAFEFLNRLVDNPGFEVAIYSSRSKEAAGREAMRDWFRKHKLMPEILDALQFPTQKPAAWLTIDDRAISFRGIWPSNDYLQGFTPWNVEKTGEAESDVHLLRELALEHPNAVSKERLLRIAERLEGVIR